MITIEQAVEKLVRYVRKHSVSLENAASKLAVEAELSDSALRTLAREALVDRARPFLTNGRRIPEETQTVGGVRYHEPKDPGPREVVVQEIRILQETSFDTVGGARKSLLVFTVTDCKYVRSGWEAQIGGLNKRCEALKYIEERLVTLGKKSVADLAQGEKTIFARMWQEAVSERAAA